MVDLKYKSPQFGTMTEEERFVTACATMLKISAVAGWSIPSERAVFDILADQFAKKMAESYANLNADELEYAFRNNTSVKDWGKAMNLSLIDEVMMPYLERRFQLSQIEEQQKKPPMIEYKESLEDESMIDWFNSVSRDVSRGTLGIDLMPVMLYDWMDKRGEINKSPKEKREYLAKAAAHRQAQLASYLAEKESPQMRKEFEEFCEMHNKGVFCDSEVDVLKNIAKRMILFDLINEKNA